MNAERIAYVDSSAINKLIQQEDESAALAVFLSPLAMRATSIFGRVEVMRSARRLPPATVRRALAVLNELVIIGLDSTIADVAAALPPAILRSLDAIHLATAFSLGDQLEAVVTYDRRMQDAARAVGLVVAAPGQV